MKKQSLYTETIDAGNRAFYFDIREAENGSNYLVISEVSKKEDGQTERRQLLIFENEIDRFAAKIGRSLLNFVRKTTSKEARIAKAKEKYPNAYEPWTKKEDDQLATLYQQGNNTFQISENLQRQPGAIKIRIEKLKLGVQQAA